MHVKNYDDPLTGSEKIYHSAILGCRVRNDEISAFPCYKLHDLRSFVTLEVTGRFRPDFTCVMFSILYICTLKIMKIL